MARRSRSRILLPQRRTLHKMASEKQIAANRRNARRSTGPRTAAGKKRATRNSFRHGLAGTRPSSAERAERVQRLARVIAGNTGNFFVLESARAIAHAVFDLAEIQRVKLGMLSREIEVAHHKSPPETDCPAEALQRTLAELIKIDRYERRAWRRRTRAIATLGDLRKPPRSAVAARSNVQNEPNFGK